MLTRSQLSWCRMGRWQFWPRRCARICEIALFSGHEGHINFLKLLVGAGVPSSPSVAKGSNQGCRQASHFDKPMFLFVSELPVRATALDQSRNELGGDP